MQEGFMERGDLSYKREAIGFVYRRCSMATTCMKSWMEDDEFVSKVWDLMQTDTTIDDAEIYKIVKPLLDERIANKKLYEGFKIQSARRGVHQLERALGI